MNEMTYGEVCRTFYLRKILEEPEIYRFKIIAFTGNTYIICSQNEILVVDPPIRSREECECFMAALQAIVEKRTNQDKDVITKLFFTHAHEMDFSFIQRYFPNNAAVYISKYEIIPTKGHNPLQYQNTRYCSEGYPKNLLKQWDAQTEVTVLTDSDLQFHYVDENAIIRIGCEELHCVHTPGHTSGHMCLLYKRQGILFSGDIFMNEMLPCVALWDENDNEIEIMLESINKLKQYTIKRTFPSHGSDTGEFGKRLEEIERQYYVRILHMYRLIYDYPGRTAYELCEFFYQNSDNWNEALPQKKWHAMGEAIAFLNYLRNKKYVAVKQSKYGLVNIPGKNKLTDCE